jgi:hypothetical protein
MIDQNNILTTEFINSITSKIYSTISNKNLKTFKNESEEYEMLTLIDKVILIFLD